MVILGIFCLPNNVLDVENLLMFFHSFKQINYEPERVEI